MLLFYIGIFSDAVSPSRKAYTLVGKYKTKEWIKLKEISVDEAKILNSMYNVPFGAYGISHSYSRHKKYYLCECKNNLMALNEIRKAETDNKPHNKQRGV